MGSATPRFHIAALCAPTRTALLSGRNHHSVGMGMITEATSAPGSSGLRPNTTAVLAMTLKLNGRRTTCRRNGRTDKPAGSPTAWDARRAAINGRIGVVQIDVGEDDHSHFIDPADVAGVAGSRP